MVFARFTSGGSGKHRDSAKARSGALKKDGGVSAAEQKCPIDLTVRIESPPCVFYGSAEVSSGALLAGLLTLKVRDDNGSSREDSLRAVKSTPTVAPGRGRSGNKLSSTLLQNSSTPNTYTHVTIDQVSLRMVQRIHYSAPFVPASADIHGCAKCRTRTTELKKWPVLRKSEQKHIGKHVYPFSYLMPGNLPATASLGASSMSHIEYSLVAIAKYTHPTTGVSGTQRLDMPVQVTRSILRGPDKNSLRVFPPTELTAAAVLPNVIHPKSSFPLELKLDGVSIGDKRWRMRKLAWRIEETTRIRANACTEHEAELKRLEQQVKKREIERQKKGTPLHPVKRYGDVGPQIRTSVSSPENMPVGRRRQVTAGLNDVLNPVSPFTEGPGSQAPVAPSVSRPATAPEQSAAGDASAANTRATSSAPAATPANPSPAPTATTTTTTTTTTSARRASARNVDIDEDNDNESVAFIHPSDDALRQELQQQQQRQRDEQIKREFKNNNSTLFTEEVRIISKGEMKSGWKTDFDNHGKIELVTDIDCMSLSTGVRNPLLHASTNTPIPPQTKPNINLAADIQDLQLGIYVNHILAVEIVVAEEALQYANGQPLSKSSKAGAQAAAAVARDDQRLAELSFTYANHTARKVRPVEEADATLTPSTSRDGASSPSKAKNDGGISAKVVSVPTGAARVLRMQFRLTVTERSGLGISWDEEVPPIYQDVQNYSVPPTYEDSESKTLSDKLQSVVSNSSIEVNKDQDVTTFTRPHGPVLTPPQMAHHGSSHNEQLNPVLSPALENVISIQGNVPMRSQVLTPASTRDMGLSGVSNIHDPDRITQ